MDVIKKGAGLILWILVSVFPGFSQVNRGYSIEVRTDKNGTLNFYCENERHITYTIRVDLYNYTNYAPSCTFPFVGEAKAGTTFLFKLTPILPSARPTYRMVTNLKLGKYIENPDSNYVYLLPIKAPGELIVSKNIFTDYWIYSPTIDTVLASRSGTVGIMTEGQADNTYKGYNSVLLEHSDGSIMSYMFLGDLFVKHGQRILAGEPIALLGKKNRAEYDSTDNDYAYCVKLSLLYNSEKLPDVQVGPIKQSSGRSTSRLPIKFITREKGEVFITKSARVTPVFPEEIITKELSKSELKKRAKKRPTL